MCVRPVAYNWCQFNEHPCDVAQRGMIRYCQAVKDQTQCPMVEYLLHEGHRCRSVPQCACCHSMQVVRGRVQQDTEAVAEALRENNGMYAECAARLQDAQAELAAYEAFVGAHGNPLDLRKIDDAFVRLGHVQSRNARNQYDRALRAATVVASTLPGWQ